MAEAAVLTPLGWVVSPLMKLLFDRAHKLLGTSIDEKRKILAATVLPRLSLAIEKAEKSENKEKLVGWLERLNHAYYKAEEAIDLFEYELLEKKVMDHRNTLMQKMKSKAARLISSDSEIKLKGRIDKLIEISKEANEFRDLLEAPDNASTSNPDRETISQPLGKVFGREQDREKVAGLLKEEPLISEPGPSITPPIPIIAIMGRSGIGKTTLAKYVYQFMEEQGYFDLLLWVHVPQKFKTADVVKNILQNIQAKDGSLHVGNYDSSVSLEVLVAQIKRKLDSKKFLLILDDFWCDTDDDIEQWEKFICCLSNGLRGSKILLTTQSGSAVKLASLAGITEIKTYSLQELEEGPFLDLFMHQAWSNDCFMQREAFETIGCQIAAKLKGDPGAAKLVGRQLRNNPNLRYWKKITQKDWLGDNMKARIWSYQQLPAHLQRCFAFCCLFPKGFRLLGPHLIMFWMAEGFIKPIDTEERMEDMGENYLNELEVGFF